MNEELDFRKTKCPKCGNIIYFETIKTFGNRCPDCGTILTVTKEEVYGKEIT